MTPVTRLVVGTRAVNRLPRFHISMGRSSVSPVSSAYRSARVTGRTICPRFDKWTSTVSPAAVTESIA